MSKLISNLKNISTTLRESNDSGSADTIDYAIRRIMLLENEKELLLTKSFAAVKENQGLRSALYTREQ